MPAFENRLPRVPFDRPVRLRVRDGSRAAADVRSANLSLGGMLIVSVPPLSVGTLVEVSLQTHPVVPIGQAEVVWASREGFGMGLRFVNIEPRARSLVEALVRHGGTSSQRPQPLDFDQLPTPRAVPALTFEPPTDPDLSSN